LIHDFDFWMLAENDRASTVTEMSGGLPMPGLVSANDEKDPHCDREETFHPGEV